MSRLWGLAIAGCWLLSSEGRAAKVDIPAAAVVESLAPGAETRPVQLSKMIVKMNRGEPFGRIKGGLICVVGEPLVWKGGRVQLDTDDFDEVFKDELEKIGFNVVSPSNDLFDTGESHRAEFLVGGTIRSMVVDVCLPNSALGDMMSSKGYALMEVEWQIYNRLDRAVVATVTTRTGAKQEKTQSGGIDSIVFSAFAENVRALAASGKLQAYLVGLPTNIRQARRPNPLLEPINLSLSQSTVRDIQGAVGATVLVQSGDGHGSGFLISSDGYFLTNYHVVGAGKFVKLRWSDGAEELGEVVRIDRGRDIALIKGDSRQRAPIKTALGNAELGSEVFAIGAPLQKQYQSSVTKGIVSASRVLDGYNYLQSDVSVVPGNSGGPLINAKGELLGVTVSGVTINNAPQGINFFIPPTEALEFLAVRSGR